MSESHPTPQNQPHPTQQNQPHPSLQSQPNQPSRQKLIAEVAVIGGGAGGLAASIALARSLRSVIVIDAGSPRNAASAHAHNVLGHEGVNPLGLLAKGRQEAEAYGVQFIDATVLSAANRTQAPETLGFDLETSVGISIEAKRIVIATGLTDVLPDIPGLADGWGDTVLHCPYCHGYEVRGQNIGIIGTTAMSYHQAMMFSQLSDRVTFLRHNAPAPDEAQRRMLDSLGIVYVDSAVEAVERTESGTVVTLRDNDSMTFDALAVGPYFRANGEIFEQLGGTVVDHPTGMGSSIPAEANGATDVPGVWAVGNSADISAMVVASAASGVLVGAQVNAELIMSSVS
ncbi:NAD(P)/FAD-dependent oxidoreductase [Brevibacterium sp. UCMA 11752]|uniref:NAD(P)/FAD-dependent oxidoreductase n=1 Tax=Brevibacterium sp. UCMA 11752 TaxID=2745946 RepID=UPI001F22A45C|nr:NAD(P)/FAD-dependent oxidoreductase [Brevibacterium sp. UCMA 11752]MCF2585676.1 NAD(P)/FAD-dependent oxidoreductase [Brevibacterium sp. UCMA 11752]MCF2586942.1 NAD(P)/FAD-dependent oxidoreductase [Brevibacterium sp. UCMA 11752]